MLDNVPVGTLTHIAIAALALIAYLNHDLTVVEALGVTGLGGIGAGQIGQARNGAGRGLKK